MLGMPPMSSMSYVPSMIVWNLWMRGFMTLEPRSFALLEAAFVKSEVSNN